MKVKVLKTDLLKAMKNACLIAPNSSSDPIISNVKIVADQALLTITSTDYDQRLTESMISDIDEVGAITVNAKKLNAVVKKLKTDEVIIETTPQNWVYLESGKVKTKLPGNDAEIFPEIEIEKWKALFSLEAKQWKEVHDLTYYAIGENESRRNLMGLNIKNKGPNISFMGADSFRITEYIIDGGNEYYDGEDEIFNVILPKTSMKVMVKVFDQFEMEFSQTVNGTRLKVTSDSMEYETRLIEAEYPQLDRLMVRADTAVSCETGSAIDAVDMLREIVERERNAALKMTAGSTLKFQSQPLEFGQGETEIECLTRGSETVLGLNIQFLLEALQVFKKQEKVMLYLHDNNTQILIDSETIENYKAVLMPVRIEW